MNLKHYVIFVCKVIITSKEKSLGNRELLFMIYEVLEEWKIPPSRALECINEYVEHIDGILKEYESIANLDKTDQRYVRYKTDKAILLEVEPLLNPLQIAS